MELLCTACRQRFSLAKRQGPTLHYRQCRQIFSVDPANQAQCPHCGTTQQLGLTKPNKTGGRELPEIGNDTMQGTACYSESELMYLQEKSGYKGAVKKRVRKSELSPLDALVEKRVVTQPKIEPAKLAPGSKRGVTGMVVLALIIASGLYRLIFPDVSLEGQANATAFVQPASEYPQAQNVAYVPSTDDLHDHPSVDLRNQRPDAWMEFIATHLDLSEAKAVVMPKGARLSSGFGYRRDPFHKTWKFHHGLDIAMRFGTPVKSLLPGKVVFSGYAQHYGKVVFVEHPHGLVTIYGHLSKITVAEGEALEKNQVLGNVGMTGRATGPHLHFEVRLRNKKLDPSMIPQLNFLTERSKAAPRKVG